MITEVSNEEYDMLRHNMIAKRRLDSERIQFESSKKFDKRDYITEVDTVAADKKEVMPITYETVAELRRRGLYIEAEKVLKQYYQELEDIKARELLNIRHIDKKIKSFYKVCSVPKCINPVHRWGYCKEHFENRIQYRNKEKQK